jgi:glycosyltransferase involved in cell wall biosynthesis
MPSPDSKPTSATAAAKSGHAVSIGLAVYNGEALLERAVGSLLAQTFRDFELIISDNASTDGTEAICRRFAALDPRIRYFRQAVNVGPVKNFDFVLQQATAPLFMWASHDDWWSPDWLDAVTSAMNDTRALVYGEFTGIDHDGKELGILRNFAFEGPSWWRLARFFLAPESGGKANIIYGLYHTAQLREFPLETLQHNIYSGADVNLLFFMLQFGDAVFTGHGRMFKRVLAAATGELSAGGKLRSYIRDQTACALGYYANARTFGIRLLVAALMPVKFCLIAGGLAADVLQNRWSRK